MMTTKKVDKPIIMKVMRKKMKRKKQNFLKEKLWRESSSLQQKQFDELRVGLLGASIF